jgi:threonine synthase
VKYQSTRGEARLFSFSEAVRRGVAPDGGLFVPARFPVFSPEDFQGREGFAEIAVRLLSRFLEGDVLAPELFEICDAAFDFPVPLRPLDEETELLELFHGPTAAFKDAGARFLAECVTRLDPRAARTVLVATSGDTGAAVAAAFYRKPGIEVVILFPEGGVSETQEKHLTRWGGNVRAFAVQGSFDDCQRMVKEAFEEKELTEGRKLLSANSINLGRLLPQVAFYAAASLWHERRTGRPAGFVVPSGNLGNAVACFWAWRSGLPIRRIALATNANRVVPDYFETGALHPTPSRPTLATAMDVANPSNLERLRHLLPDLAALRRVATARAVSDEEIREMIREGASRWDVMFCPHTATAVRLREELGRGDWIVVATAHPAKFRETVEPLVGGRCDSSGSLGWLESRPPCFERIRAELGALRAALARAQEVEPA